MQTPFLIGPNVYLRPVEPEEAASVVPWFNDPEVTRFIQRYRPLTGGARGRISPAIASQ